MENVSGRYSQVYNKKFLMIQGIYTKLMLKCVFCDIIVDGIEYMNGFNG